MLMINVHARPQTSVLSRKEATHVTNCSCTNVLPVAASLNNNRGGLFDCAAELSQFIITAIDVIYIGKIKLNACCI